MEKLIPAYMKAPIEEFHDRLCRVLTDWETSEISDFEPYSFMVDLANKIAQIAYDDETEGCS